MEKELELHKELTRCKEENKVNNFLVLYCYNNLVSCKKAGFTLAEVLITLAIIGIVAAMTIPTLISKYQDTQFKAAYKKAYSDFNQVLLQALAYNEMPYRSTKYDDTATLEEWELIKEGFKMTKECDKGDLYSCWKKGDTICGGTCATGEYDEDGNAIIDANSGAPYLSAWSFVDASGRSWSTYTSSENIYLVDTNGFAGPNRFGKDRWIFTFADAQNNRVSIGIPVKVRPYRTKDYLTQDSFCKQPPCYYYSWLYER